MAKQTLEEILAENTKEGELSRALPDGRVECFACGLRCPIPEGKDGVCKVRFNRGGKLFVPFGYVSGLQDDPIEKKPFYHVMPGSRAMSFGMLGCDFHCSFCQNWVTTQTLRDPEAVSSVMKIKPQQVAEIAIKTGCRSVISTYNEPLITSEWAAEIFKEAKEADLVTGYVSNGNATPEVLDYLRPWLDLYKVDLKGFDDKHYRELGGALENVCRTIRDLYERKFYMEIVTLLIPGFNDSDEEIKKLTGFIAAVSPEIPWHVTAFHPDYRMTDRSATSSESLARAASIGRESGLHYVYAGNLPGAIEGGEDTRCPHCREVLIKRLGYRILEDKLTTTKGRCFSCQAKIPGFWAQNH
ncbi:MAG: AmmeMemoRadiSam system radical SAM enzyme [Candidatus Omnitrophota bacterium]